MMHTNTKLQSSNSGQPAPASKRRSPRNRDVNTTPTVSVGSGDSKQSASNGAKPPVTSHAKKIPIVRYPVIINKDKESQINPLPDKTTPHKGRSVVPVPRPETVPLRIGVKMDGDIVNAVEIHTRGQRENPSWFSWRQNRITASTAHCISHSRFVNGTSPTPAASYLANITGQGSNVKTRAMTWGIEMEAEAVCRYQILKSKALGRPVRVQECGLFIDSQRPWLAASPDGIVLEMDGKRLLCLEVKCPYKHRQNTVAQACKEDRTFCLEIQDGKGTKEPHYRLKPKHSYYTQIQCQLAVTGLPQADLVVFTLQETAIVPVTFDPVFWESTVSKLELFYKDAVLPHVREKGLDIKAMKPEE